MTDRDYVFKSPTYSFAFASRLVLVALAHQHRERVDFKRLAGGGSRHVSIRGLDLLPVVLIMRQVSVFDILGCSKEGNLFGQESGHGYFVG
jgi:hypothetical protein